MSTAHVSGEIFQGNQRIHIDEPLKDLKDGGGNQEVYALTPDGWACAITNVSFDGAFLYAGNSTVVIDGQQMNDDAIKPKDNVSFTLKEGQTACVTSKSREKGEKPASLRFEIQRSHHESER